MSLTFPFLTAYDPPGTSEGTLDPLGLYTIADQLAVQLVPAVRERMQRVRFLTAMAVGALVMEQLDPDLHRRNVAPSLVWEWLVVEALVRDSGEDSRLWGDPGTLVTRRALDHHDYLDVRSYLKTPRIFGFHGVYKRLAMHLGLVDVHLAPGPNAESLVDAWAKDLGFGGIRGAKSVLADWVGAVARSLEEKPARTKSKWNLDEWRCLAKALTPYGAGRAERRFLRDHLRAVGDRQLGALPAIWRLNQGFSDNDFREEALHDRLASEEPMLCPLLSAIGAYERFARSMQEAFDLLRAEASVKDCNGFEVTRIASDPGFQQSMRGLETRHREAAEALAHLGASGTGVTGLFLERFRSFAEAVDAGECAIRLCAHHEDVQRSKSATGKRPWFDRLGGNRVYLRHAYRVKRGLPEPGRYVHAYRGQPIRRFYSDLS